MESPEGRRRLVGVRPVACGHRPRGVLRELGVELEDDVEVHGGDSTAEILTRDSMQIRIGAPSLPAVKNNTKPEPLEKPQCGARDRINVRGAFIDHGFPR